MARTRQLTDLTKPELIGLVQKLRGENIHLDALLRQAINDNRLGITYAKPESLRRSRVESTRSPQLKFYASGLFPE